MRDEPSLFGNHDDFERQAESTMRNAALANVGGLIAGAAAALGTGWVVYTTLALGELATLAASIVLGLIAGTVVGNIVALVLSAFVLASFFGGDGQ